MVGSTGEPPPVSPPAAEPLTNYRGIEFMALDADRRRDGEQTPADLLAGACSAVVNGICASPCATAPPTATSER
jgi:hypothetical protein